MTSSNDNSDLHDICKHIIDKSNIKYIFFIFIIYIITSSNFFENNCLRIPEINKNNNLLPHLIKKATIFIILFILTDQLIQYNVL